MEKKSLCRYDFLSYLHFHQKRIPSAQYFNLEEICQKEGSLIKKLPTSDQFKKAIESLGISTNDEIVLYDSQGVYSAARVWYMFNIFNKNAKVHVMNGGMIRWETEKYPIDEKPYKAPTAQGSFEVNPDFSLVCTLDEMKQRVKDYKEGLTKRTVIDCRRVCCFTGTCKVPIANVPLGHIPGSVNIPFHYMTDPYNNYMMRKPDELKQIFEKHGVMVHEPEKMIFSCDYGISSCVNLFAMHLLGRPLEKQEY